MSSPAQLCQVFIYSHCTDNPYQVGPSVLFEAPVAASFSETSFLI